MQVFEVLGTGYRQRKGCSNAKLWSLT